MENKVVNFSFENSKLILTVDPNKDGQAVLRLEVELAELPDEIAAIFAKKNA